MSSKTITVGQSFIQTITAQDGSVLAPGSVAASNTSPSIATVTPNGDNTFTVKGVAPGTTNITYVHPGNTNAMESVIVSPVVLVPLVITDGPVL